MAMIAVNDTCECFIEVHWSNDNKISKIRMIYCPMHSATEPLHVALVWALAQLQQGGGIHDNDYYTVVRMAEAAIALYEGKK